MFLSGCLRLGGVPGVSRDPGLRPRRRQHPDGAEQELGVRPRRPRREHSARGRSRQAVCRLGSRRPMLIRLSLQKGNSLLFSCTSHFFGFFWKMMVAKTQTQNESLWKYKKAAVIYDNDLEKTIVLHPRVVYTLHKSSLKSYSHLIGGFVSRLPAVFSCTKNQSQTGSIIRKPKIYVAFHIVLEKEL